jgi:hypothetical protein
MEFNLSDIDISQLANLDKLWMAVVIFILFLWLLCIIYVVKDVSARTDSQFLQIISILFVTFLTPIVWLPLYWAIRPVWYKRDKTPWRDACLTSSIECESCGCLNPKEYDCCLQCGKKLKLKCKECDKEYPHNYHYCPYCGAPNLDA